MLQLAIYLLNEERGHHKTVSTYNYQRSFIEDFNELC